MDLSSARAVLLTEGSFGLNASKTAVVILRYGRPTPVAVIDSEKAGQDVGDLLGFAHGIPVVACLKDALRFNPDVLVVGISPRGGGLPPEWRPIIREAIRSGLTIVSGLHYFLSEDPELADLARKEQVTIWDVRKPIGDFRLPQPRPRVAPPEVILTVGTDCNVGKMTVAYEMTREAVSRGRRARFIATGQTGIIMEGNGIPVDGVVGDFMAGAAQQMVIDNANQADLLIVEGQGSIGHPAFSGVSLALLHGCQPDYLVLCHWAARERIRGYDVRIPPMGEIIGLYERTAALVKPTRTIAVAISTIDLAEAEAREHLAVLQEELGLTVADCIRFGPGPLVDALEGVL